MRIIRIQPDMYSPSHSRQQSAILKSLAAGLENIGNSMSSKPFKRVALMIRENAPKQVDSLRHTIAQLKDHAEIVIEASSAAQLGNCYNYIVPADQLKQHADLIISIGGDGSLINAARVGVMQDLPVVGINRGKLGFLTDIHPDDHTTLLAVLNGEYNSEQRLLIEVQTNNDAPKIAVNDIVLSPGMMARMLQFEIKINQQLLYRQRADGLIIATPTGSTAYALSGGGPILTPGLDVLTLVPMFPHKLSSRPIVVNANSTLQITITRTDGHNAQMSYDGNPGIKLQEKDTITIKQYSKKLELIHPKTYNYYTTLRDKLGWEKSRV